MIAYSPRSERAAAVAETLAAALDLSCGPLRDETRDHALLTVAPASERTHQDPVTPVVVVPSAARVRGGVSGRIVLCGVEDERDAPSATTAAAIAQALGLCLVLAHTIPPPVHAAAAGPLGPPLIRGLTVEDRALAGQMIGRVARAAGVEETSSVARRVLRGAPGPTLAAVARAEHAAMVVVSASVRSLLLRALLGSATRYLARRLDRPLVVCPRDPRPAMRVREALSPTSIQT